MTDEITLTQLREHEREHPGQRFAVTTDQLGVLVSALDDARRETNAALARVAMLEAEREAAERKLVEARAEREAAIALAESLAAERDLARAEATEASRQRDEACGQVLVLRGHIEQIALEAEAAELSRWNAPLAQLEGAIDDAKESMSAIAEKPEVKP